MPSRTNGLRVLMLATDAHGGFGGIAQYNRDVLDALAHNERVREIVVVPRIVVSRNFTAPERVRYDMQSTRGQAAFIRRGLFHALRGGPIDLVYCGHINLMPLAALIARLRRAPLVLAIYGIDAWQPPASGLTRRALRACDLVVSISRITLDRFQEWNGKRPAATAILPNAIRALDYGPGDKDPELVARHGLAGRKVLMTLGRIAPDERYKGFDEVIEILPRLRAKEPTIAYLAVGDGDDRRRLEAKAEALGVADLIVFTGRIPEERKADYYRLADAYLMPSSGEGFGFVVLEALACGIPVVASTADGTREAVKNGELGLLVDPKDPNSLERAILEALGRPKQVPAGLDYFSFANFEQRLRAALSQLVPV